MGEADCRRALLDQALDVGGAAAVLLDLFDRQGRLSQGDAGWFVPRAWDASAYPMSVLPRGRWVVLFRLAGYTHEFEPAQRPGGPLRLYRGSDSVGRGGMCWTSNVDVARWMASRFTDGAVYVAEVGSERLLAFLAPGYEDQFVVDTEGLAVEEFEAWWEVGGLDVEQLMDRLDEAAGVGGERG